MPKKLVCVFGSDFYNDHADSRLLVKSMVRNGTDQSTCFVQTKTPLLDEPEPVKATGIKGRFQRKHSVTNKAPTLPPYTQAVSDAYTFLNEQYQPDVQIILFAVTGTPHDWPVLRAATRVLAQHLEAGTVPPRLAQDTASTVDSERDEFGDRPLKEPPNNILGKKIESSVAIVCKDEFHIPRLTSNGNTDRSTSPITEINNALLEEFPLSVKSIFSFNWAVGHENYCHTFRDEAGQITSREVGYFKNIQWHIPVVINATMSFIHYEPKETTAWRTIKRVTPRTLTSLPTPLIPECPPSPITASPPPPRKSRFTLRFGSRQKSESRSSTLPSIRSTQRSSTLMSGYTTTRRSDTLMSGFSTNSFGPRVSSPPPTMPNSASSFTSTSTSDMTSSPRTSTVLTESSCASNDSSRPSLREAYISLPGMTKHQVWAYPAFLTTRDNYALPERVIWRSSRE